MTSIGDLITEHYGAMRKQALKITLNHDTADDLVQSACLELLKYPPKNHIDSPVAFLRGAVRITFYKQLYAARRLPKVFTAFDPSRHVVTVEPSQEFVVDINVARGAIRKMTPFRQRLFDLVIAGYSMTEIGEIVGSSKQSISMTLKSARRALVA